MTVTLVDVCVCVSDNSTGPILVSIDYQVNDYYTMSVDCYSIQ